MQNTFIIDSRTTGNPFAELNFYRLHTCPNHDVFWITIDAFK